MQTEANITASEIRDRDFAAMRAALPEMCVRVHAAFCAHGPGTTREVAWASGIDILSLRPRACDLLAEGWLECVARKGHEGVYRALTPVDRAALCAAARAHETGSEQMQLRELTV